MPELPEVQTIVNDLQILSGDTITDFHSAWPKVLKDATGKTISEKSFCKIIKNKKIISIQRLGKNIILNLSEKISLVAHLRMTGQLLIIKTKTWQTEVRSKHVHHFFLLKKHGVLAFSDVRKFATLQILPTAKLNELGRKLGIDPFAENFSFKNFQKLFAHRYNKSIKEFLMDQTIILGIGNIYASEILFDASIHPARHITSLSPLELKTLYASIIKILTKAIRLRGTSVSDYRDASGKRGQFQNELKVYKKVDQPCPKCATIITRKVLGQRSSFFCAKCQK